MKKEKKQTPPRTANVAKDLFGETPEGEQVFLFTLTNESGSIAKITNYGGIVVSLQVPDRNGNLGEVVLGFDNLEAYIADKSYQGALIGRYGNRIANGKFSLLGENFTLATNNDPNHLHGGEQGFNKKVWKAAPMTLSDGVGLRLTYTSPDGEEGYPGNLKCTVTYTFSDDNELRIDYRADTDRPTLVNFTQHSYFNLKDGGNSSIVDHELLIHADSIIPVNKNLIPTGELQVVSGSPFDFTTAKKMGSEIDADDPQIKFGGGYDHCWVIKQVTNERRQATAEVYEPVSGRVMKVTTTEPGVQFYSGNFLDGTMVGRGGVAYQKQSGFCLETQHYPDSPNHPKFPSAMLDSGDLYQSSTSYAFSAR